MRSSLKFLCAVAALALLGSPALAANYVFSGDTTGDPVFNRPVSLTSLSGVGTAVAYEVIPFYVTVTGTYQFEVRGITHPDTYALVYSTFSPGSPLTGLLDGDDDYSGAMPMLGGTGTGFASSRIAPGESSNFTGGTGLALTAFTQYFAVVTAFDNPSFGTYEAALGNGPGDAVGGLVPEPASVALGAIGLAAAVSIGIRRRRAA